MQPTVLTLVMRGLANDPPARTKRGATARIAFLAATLAISLVASTSHAVDCNDTIQAGSSIKLDPTVDFTSGACSGEALTIIGPVKVDMAGTEIECSSGGTIGIVLAGSGVKLENGAVRGCEGGIYLAGTGGHRISRMTITWSEFTGIAVATDSNILKENVVRKIGPSGLPQTGIAGVQVVGANNRLFSNAVMDVNAGSGIEINGVGNRLKDNKVIGARSFSGDTIDTARYTEDCFDVRNTTSETSFKGDVASGCFTGFRIAGDQTSVQKCSAVDTLGWGILIEEFWGDPVSDVELKNNTVQGSRFVGIELAHAVDGRVLGNSVIGSLEYGLSVQDEVASGNLIKGNNFLGSGFWDIYDQSFICDNSYEKNTYGTSESDDNCVP